MIVEASVVVPTYNQLERLKKCIDSLSKQLLINKCEVIVINDGSTDSTKEYLDSLDYKWLRVVHQNNSGRSYTRNKGIDLAKSDIIIFLDGDIVVPSNFIKVNVKKQHTRAGVYISDIINIPDKNFTKFIELYSTRKNEIQSNYKQLEKQDILVNMARHFARYNNNNEVSWVCMVGASVSIHKKYLLKAGKFDEKFKGWGVEDHDLAFRLKNSGAKFYYLSNLKVYHLDKLKAEIKMEELLGNLSYLGKKYNKDIEAKSYIDFVTGKSNLKNLYESTVHKKCPNIVKQIYFKPMQHLKSKEMIKGKEYDIVPHRPTFLKTIENKNIVVLSPHPDDEIIGMGGYYKNLKLIII